MVSKRSRPSGKSPGIQGDNFKIIQGVNTVIESCLHRAGILTYAQFASLSPDDIITIVGNIAALSPEKVMKQNWTGQARELALKTMTEEQVEKESVGEDVQTREGNENQRAEKFTTEFSLD